MRHENEAMWVYDWKNRVHVKESQELMLSAGGTSKKGLLL